MNRVDRAKILLDAVYAKMPAYQRLLESDRDWLDDARLDVMRREIVKNLTDCGFKESDIKVFFNEYNQC